MSDFMIGYKIPSSRLALTISDYLLDYDENVECFVQKNDDSVFLFVKNLTMYNDSVKWFTKFPYILEKEFNVQKFIVLILQGRMMSEVNLVVHCRFVAEQHSDDSYIILKHPLVYNISSSQYTLPELYKKILCLK